MRFRKQVCVRPSGISTACYTTFSTFSIEAIHLLELGHLILAALYIGASVVLSIAAAFFGAYLPRHLRFTDS
ncbi:putative fluoride ion transporter CrcB [mine drainage metagenome]|uniref:Putative fluoride ion transporter CrcB n=1 Tax=mine drainage metagenome TaxID=410659 RepID=A0A1J5RWS8_9ZZZZ